mmetsp:Transcript_10122/g.8919  ORF Transcript_10122/g.8919 Transcript_10122/m.8919 type:complete len:332 (-) Transcript_10122:133-1128(-)
MDSLNINLCYGQYFLESTNQFDKLIAEYIWIDGTGASVRSKSRTLSSKISSISDLPEWNFDGSSTGQAPGHDSEVILKPVNFYPDPFRGGDNILVLCSCHRYDSKAALMKPANTNFRDNAVELFNTIEDHQPFTKILQSCTLYKKMSILGQQQLGWPEGGFPASKGNFYNGVGTNNSHGRSIMDSYLQACLYIGVKISNLNSGEMPGEWEFEIGPCKGVETGDQLWMARYLLSRITEDFGTSLTFEPKPIKGNLKKKGCFTKFFTISMRENSEKGISFEGEESIVLSSLKVIELDFHKITREELSTEGDESDNDSISSSQKLGIINNSSLF